MVSNDGHDRDCSKPFHVGPEVFRGRTSCSAYWGKLLVDHYLSICGQCLAMRNAQLLQTLGEQLSD